MTAADDRFVEAKALCGRHKAAAQPRKQDSIDLLWTTLEAMRAGGVPDYSIARVGRELELRGGPKIQSIRNAQGAYLREIIAAYAEAAQVPKRVEAQDKTNADRALSLIPDQNVRYVLTLEIQRLRKLKRENDDLRAALRQITLQSAPIAREAPAIEVMPPVSQLGLTPRLLAGLLKSMDSGEWAERGYWLDERGAIMDDAGHEIFATPFAEAVLAVLAAATADDYWSERATTELRHPPSAPSPTRKARD